MGHKCLDVVLQFHNMHSNYHLYRVIFLELLQAVEPSFSKKIRRSCKLHTHSGKWCVVQGWDDVTTSKLSNKIVKLSSILKLVLDTFLRIVKLAYNKAI